jgi:hypothetical protein
MRFSGRGAPPPGRGREDAAAVGAAGARGLGGGRGGHGAEVANAELGLAVEAGHGDEAVVRLLPDLVSKDGVQG